MLETWQLSPIEVREDNSKLEQKNSEKFQSDNVAQRGQTKGCYVQPDLLVLCSFIGFWPFF